MKIYYMGVEGITVLGVRLEHGCNDVPDDVATTLLSLDTEYRKATKEESRLYDDEMAARKKAPVPAKAPATATRTAVPAPTPDPSVAPKRPDAAPTPKGKS